MNAKKRKIRLAVVISSLTIGGAEQLLLTMLHAIDRNRFDVTLIFLREPGLLGKEFLSLGFSTYTGILRNRFDFTGIFRLLFLFRKLKVDVLLLINHRNSLFYGITAAKLAGVPAIVNWQNETFLRYSYHEITMLGRRILLKGADRIVAAAKGHIDYIKSVEKIPRDKIVYIYNGVIPERFQSDLTPAQAKERLFIPPDCRVISIIAVLRPDKAHEDFLKAAALILKRRQDVHFLIIGDGPRRSFLEDTAKRLSISSNVHFLGFRRQIADILAAVDINTLSSKPEQETLSVAAIEAMAAGKPIVCTDVGFMREIVIHGKTGYIVPVGNPVKMAEKILYILETPGLLQAMGENARKLVKDMLSVDKMTRQFEELFEEILFEKDAV